MNEKERLQAFKDDLKELLKKHNCTIDFLCDETQGLSGEGMGVSFNDGNAPSIRLNYDLYLDSTHLG